MQNDKTVSKAISRK